VAALAIYWNVADLKIRKCNNQPAWTAIGNTCGTDNSTAE